MVYWASEAVKRTISSREKAVIAKSQAGKCGQTPKQNDVENEENQNGNTGVHVSMVVRSNQFAE